MPSHRNGRHYNLVSEDSLETGNKYTEQDFNIGINFYAKIVGKIEVPQPNHRNEIVAAMRRIRYESKTTAQKKQRVKISISIDGIIVTLLAKKMKLQWWKNEECVIYQHPIHRVFYVSHDAQDINIFSYIVRDNVTDIFMCIAFKAYSEKEAIEVVGAIGHSFEICHKINTELVAKQKLDEINQEDSKTPDSKSFKDADDSKFDFKIDGSSEKIENPKHSETDDIGFLENSNSSNCISNNIPSSESENKDDLFELPSNLITYDSNIFKYEQLLRLNKMIVTQNEEIKLICNGLNTVKMSLNFEQKISKRLQKFCQKIDKQNIYLLKELEDIRNRMETIETKLHSVKCFDIGYEDNTRETNEQIHSSFSEPFNRDIFHDSFTFNKEFKLSSKDNINDDDNDLIKTFFKCGENFLNDDIIDENANFDCSGS